ncbi:hypothetical protein T484DRAFT_2961178 [Baffinella frigidus]|nr:hypothetical protein T484DRAFT_2961178 [Cryptophyta sp. CCMP2293]
MILSPAPVQLSFKGFAGSTGLPEHHAIVSDRVVTPPEMATFFAEKLLLLPHSYHYNGHDSLYAHLFDPNGPAWPTRQDLVEGRYMMSAAPGARQVETLPAAAAEGPLLCNFNQFYKLVPVVWASWMALLRELPTARLWLLSWNDAGKRSLLAKAAEAGVDPARIVFSTFFEERFHVAAKGVRPF